MELPKNQRRTKDVLITPSLWLYGESYSGKTTFADSFDNNLMINTDGNYHNVTSPVVQIADTVMKQGRLPAKRVFAWENFKALIEELEGDHGGFEVITLDLLEDVREHCRLYVYDKNKWQHESDGSFGKGWDMVQTEFASTLKRLKNIGVPMIFLSKQVVGEVNRANGIKITTYRPNLPDKIANICAGMVDMTGRIIVKGDNRYISFKSDDYIFGGTRYNLKQTDVLLDKDSFMNSINN
jgi:hypothetical protein